MLALITTMSCWTYHWKASWVYHRNTRRGHMFQRGTQHREWKQILCVYEHQVVVVCMSIQLVQMRAAQKQHQCDSSLVSVQLTYPDCASNISRKQMCTCMYHTCMYTYELAWSFRSGFFVSCLILWTQSTGARCSMNHRQQWLQKKANSICLPQCSYFRRCCHNKWKTAIYGRRSVGTSYVAGSHTNSTLLMFWSLTWRKQSKIRLCSTNVLTGTFKTY